MQTSYHMKHPQTSRITVMAFLTPDIHMGQENRWILNRIAVARGTPLGQGWGTKLLEHICACADAEGATLWLGVDPDEYNKFWRLCNWYRRHGFKPEHSPGVTRVHNVMERKPR